MRAGLLTRRMQIQQGASSSDTEGNATMAWTPVADVWAAISPLGTQELILAAQRSEEITHQITIRYQSQWIAVQDLRLIYKGRTFFVVGATDPDEANLTLVLKVKEYVTGAEVAAT